MYRYIYFIISATGYSESSLFCLLSALDAHILCVWLVI